MAVERVSYGRGLQTRKGGGRNACHDASLGPACKHTRTGITHTGHELCGGPRRDTPTAVLSVPNTISSEANKAEARTGTWEVQDESGT